MLMGNIMREILETINGMEREFTTSLMATYMKGSLCTTRELERAK